MFSKSSFVDCIFDMFGMFGIEITEIKKDVNGKSSTNLFVAHL